MASPYAFVTLLTSDYYLPGALTLAAALRDTHPSPALPPEVDFQTVCLVTPETVDVASIKLLRKAFDVVVGVEIIEENNERGLQLLGRPDLTTVLTKLHVFRLTQYSKIIFLDADILPIRTLSHLFTLPHDFSAVPDVGWPDIFNSGFMVLSPGEDKFNELMTLSKTKGSWDGADQGLLNEWRGSNWNRLSFTYNTTPTAVYTYAPAYERFGSQISAIHFIGASKPWSSIPWRAPGSVTAQSVASQPLQVYDYGSLVDRWYAVYDKHYRSQPVIPQAAYASTRYAAAWDEGSTAAPNAFAVPAASVMSLEELRQIAIEGFSGISGVTRTSVATAGEGNYTSLPLEGRLDLMRPRPKSENGHESNASMEGQQAPDEDDRGHQSTLEDNAGSSTPKARPHLLYSGDYLPGSPSVSEQHGPLMPNFGSESSTAMTPVSSLTWQPGPHHTAHRQIQPGPTSLLPPDQTRSYYTGGHPTREVRSQFTAQPPTQSHSGIGQSYLPSAQVQGPTQRLLRMAHEQEPRQQAYLQGQVQVLKPDLHHPQPDSGILVRHDLEHTHEPSHQSAQLLQEPIRPVSPPLMTWNPAVEPPPSTAPVSSFPVTTYYPNVWDQSLQYLSDSSSSRDISSTLFAVPPPSRIPERLVQEKHYVNVLGDDRKGETPSPDRGKIKPVFPWEDKPRLTPGRVFPSTDSPPPGQFLLPAVETGSPSPSPPLRFSPTQLYASSPPPSGFPPSFSYSNAWDTVPSIQRYASRLVRPPQNVPPLAPAFDFGESRRRDSALFRNWRESEESSVDGDDEDTGDEGGAASPNKQRSRSGSLASAPYPGGKSRKKEYRSQGVQTIPKETKDQSVQVTVLTDATDANRSLKDLERRQDDVAKLSPLGSPTGLRSPRYTSPRGSSTNLAESTPRPTLYKPVQRSSALQRGGVEQRLTPASFSRTISSDTASSPSSAPPTSPADSRPIQRAGGRVWDPARGVEIFKKGSEEVLSRFLRMGSWEEEKQSLSPT
ncbi:glycosyltransferase family 8 protein [Lactarius sanguifluus]|nr:glycosyltransferase family 8 protein [Lactarius sanguifluus]